jgi:hypothetical protein
VLSLEDFGHYFDFEVCSDVFSGKTLTIPIPTVLHSHEASESLPLPPILKR